MGQAPVCLFPMRQMCRTFNNEMLQQLTTKVYEQMKLIKLQQKKWKKAIEHLEKPNDSKIRGKAVGARVMPCRNIDTKTGLVSCALVHIKRFYFDHVSRPYDVDSTY